MIKHKKDGDILLEDYYFLRLFDKSHYREEANNGTKLHINNMNYFWENENKFQQDFEGKIFCHSGRGYIISAKDDIKDIIKSAASVNEILHKLPDKDNVIFETKDVAFKINGYIYCFYLLPKKSVIFKNNRMFFTNDKDKNDYNIFIKRYLEENNSYYGSIYDARVLWYLLCNEMSKKGYKVAANEVEYKALSDIDRIQLFQANKCTELVFTKDVAYKYQREYRFFFSTNNQTMKKFIEVEGIALKKSKIADFDYEIV